MRGQSIVSGDVYTNPSFFSFGEILGTQEMYKRKYQKFWDQFHEILPRSMAMVAGSDG